MTKGLPGSNFQLISQRRRGVAWHCPRISPPPPPFPGESSRTCSVICRNPALRATGGPRQWGSTNFRVDIEEEHACRSRLAKRSGAKCASGRAKASKFMFVEIPKCSRFPVWGNEPKIQTVGIFVAEEAPECQVSQRAESRRDMPIEPNVAQLRASRPNFGKC